MADAAPKQTLLELATRHFGGEDPLPAERKLFEATGSGQKVDCNLLQGDERAIRSDRISWLCTDPDASTQVTHRGVWIIGAQIDGDTNLEYARISFPLRAHSCTFGGAINLNRSHLVFLDLEGSTVSGIEANAMQVDGDVFLSAGFTAGETVDLVGATIGGDLDCHGGHFATITNTPAFGAYGAIIRGSVLLSLGFKAAGGANLSATDIGGNLFCNGGWFVSNKDTVALAANGSKVHGNFALSDGFKAKGCVGLLFTEIGGSLICSGGRFVNSGNTPALCAKGAKIEGFAILSPAFTACGIVDFSYATINLDLECEGGKFASRGAAPALLANSTRVLGSVHLGNGFRAKGGVDFKDATLGGNLMCEGGRFVGRSGIPALNVTGAEIQGVVALVHGFRAEGGVVLAGAKIGRNLVCDSGQFGSKDEALALNANSATIQGHAFLRDTVTAEGGVDFTATTIGGNLECDGGHFVSKGNAPALLANGAKIQGSVHLRRGFNATGGADFTITTIGGHFECDAGVCVSRGQIPALNLGGTTIHGAVFLWRNFTAEGGVDLKFAKIGGNLDCYLGKFIAMGAFMALNANGANIEGNVGLRGNLWGNFDAVGQVNFSGATIGGNLECSNGHFKAQGQKAALLVNSATVLGSVHLSTGFTAVGEVDFTNAKIGGNFDCDSGQFIGQNGALAVIGDGAKIEGSAYFRGTEIVGEVRFGFAHIERNFQWFRIKSREKVTLDLRFTNVRILLNDDEDSWPKEGKLNVDGFVYEKLDTEASSNAEMQLGWLRLQPRNRFLSQPFEQLATVFRNMGLEEDARKVMIEKNKEHGRQLHLPIWDWRPWMWIDWISWFFRFFWYRIFGNVLVGYGYRPGRAFGWSILVIALGWLFFKLGYDWKVVTPTGDKAYLVEKDGARRIKNGRPQLSEDYPKFNALVYSVETFVPLLKLGMGEYWGPNAKRDAPRDDGMLGKMAPKNFGNWLRCYMWLHIILGWVLGTLWIGGLTKLLKT